MPAAERASSAGRVWVPAVPGSPLQDSGASRMRRSHTVELAPAGEPDNTRRPSTHSAPLL